MIAMQELDGYRFILDEGAIKFARKLIRKLGEQRFGASTEKQANKLDAIEDLDRLERMSLAAASVKNWDDLLAVK